MQAESPPHPDTEQAKPLRTSASPVDYYRNPEHHQDHTVHDDRGQAESNGRAAVFVLDQVVGGPTSAGSGLDTAWEVCAGGGGVTGFFHHMLRKKDHSCTMLNSVMQSWLTGLPTLH